MTDIRPVEVILDFWAKSLNCPLCEKEGLSVTRQVGAADLLCCPRCGSQFQFEQGGTRIRLVQLPVELHDQLLGQWLTYEEVRAIAAEDTRKSAQVQPFALQKREPKAIPVTGIQVLEKPAAIPVRTPKIEKRKVIPPKRAVDQAQQLYDLGNTFTTIRGILERDPALTPEQVDQVMHDLQAPYRQKQYERILFSLLIIVSMVVAGLFLTYSGALVTLSSSARGLFTEDGLQLIPLEPKLTYYYPSGYRYFCPSSQENAAQLFGGKIERWRFGGKAWNYLDVRATHIFVPEGLKASYAAITRGFLRTYVDGPVLVENTFSLTIDCE